MATKQEPVDLGGIKKAEANRVNAPKQKLFSEQDDPMFWLAVAGGIVIIVLFLRCFGVF